MGFVKIVETVGSSPTGWEDALKAAVEDASNLPIFKSKGNITQVNVKSFDVDMKDNKVSAFKCRVEIFLE